MTKALALPLGLLAAAWACGVEGTPDEDGPAGWHRTIEAGRTAAEASGKPLLLVFR